MNKTNIEEDIKIANEVLLHNRETKEVRQAIKNILADREINKVKANKYDTLAEKMKEKLEELKEEDSEIYDTDSEDLIIAKYETRAMIDTLQELIPEEE